MSERSKAKGKSGSHCAERKGYLHLDKMYRALTFCLCTMVCFNGVYETPKVVFVLGQAKMKSKVYLHFILLSTARFASKLVLSRFIFILLKIIKLQLVGSTIAFLIVEIL